MALNDFDYISDKIRKITGRPSTNQLTAEEIVNYINSFMVYDLPLHTRLFYNKQIYSFQLTPNVSIYSIAAIKNIYSNFEPPAYIDGFQIQYIQNEQTFFQMYPRLKYSTNFATGNGGAGPYSGTFLYVPIQPNTVVISAVTAVAANVLAIDDGTLPIGGFVDETGAAIAGATINYATGAIAGITFTGAVPVGNRIYISANEYVTGRPFTVLYFNNEFRFWPFPDRAYTFQIDAWPNPTATTVGGGASFPELNEWADVIAFGASLKIFADNLDMESYGKVKILFDEAKELAERRTLKQLSNQRVSTIYDDGVSWPSQFYGYPYS